MWVRNLNKPKIATKLVVHDYRLNNIIVDFRLHHI